ncbi:transporter substrate-binding domain-containing protein [bacterium]|nr:transporter substrate-binding domain-containing protein [bacterium]
MRQVLIISLLLLSSCSQITLPSKQVRIGIDADFIEAPVGHKSAAVNAFTNELLEVIFKPTRYQIIYIPLSFDNMEQNLETKNTALIVSSKEMLYLAKKEFSFSSMFLSLGDVFITRRTMQVTSFSDFEGKIISLPTRSELIPYFAPFKDLQLNFYTSIPQTLENLVSGRADGAMIPYLELSSNFGVEYQRLLKVSKERYTDRGLRLLSLKGKNMAVLRTFNKRLAAMKDDGSYDALLKKWNLTL